MKQSIEEAAREELIHSYANIYNGNGIFEYGQDAMFNMFLKGAEWQSEQSPWISVEERLPEDNTGVFFVVEWKDLHKGYFVGLYNGNGQWESDHRIFLPDSSLGRITHWMPIPKFNE